MELISVIIPVYNVEPYLRICVESVLRQTYHNLEVILVDDGSTDQSPAICDELARTDKRIRVLHDKNEGLSVARNRGMAVASGEYIAFVDSDDYLTPAMYEVMHNRMEKVDADLAICSFDLVDEAGVKREQSSPVKDEVLEAYDALKKLDVKQKWFYITAWNRLYRRKILEHVQFPPGKLHEDVFVAHEVIEACDKVVTVSAPLYIHRITPGSIMTSKPDIRRLDGVEGAYYRFLHYEQRGWKDLLHGAYQCGRDHLEVLGEISSFSSEDKKRLREIMRMYRYMFWRAKGNKQLKNCIIASFPRLYFMVKYLKRRNT